MGKLFVHGIEKEIGKKLIINDVLIKSWNLKMRKYEN
jgi:hypothetical protein